MPAEITDIEMSQHPWRTIWRLAWPQMIMLVIHSMIGLIDVWVAGRLDSNVQASLGIITQALFFFMVVATAVANGSVAAISQSMGAGLYKRIQRYVGLCLMLALACGGLILAVGLPFKSGLLTLLRVPEQLFPITDDFLEIYLYVLPAYYFLMVTNAIFRAQKRVKLPLFSMTVVTVLNGILDFGLGLGAWGMPNLGYKGLAWATFGSVLAGALFNLFLLLKLKLLMRRSFAPMKWNRAALPYLLKVAWPAGMLQVVWHSAYLVLFSITATLPEGNVTALAGMTTGLRIESFLFLPGFAFNFTASILVGHYLGAGKPEEAKKFGYRILLFGLAVVLPLAALAWQFVEPIARELAPNPAVSAEAVNYLFFNILAMPFILTSFTMAGSFNGAGATLYNMVVFGLSSWAIRLPLAYYMGHVWLGSATGIWASMLISQGFQATIMLGVYSYCNWQRFSMLNGRNTRKRILECTQTSSPLPSKTRASIAD